MRDAIAVLNAGSSSVKLPVFAERDGDLEVAARGQAEGLYASPRGSRRCRAHEFRPRRCGDIECTGKTRSARAAAPAAQPAPIRALLERAPPLPQVACFDTAFHCRALAVAQAFALPMAITDRGVRRYGFHGLSYEYIAGVLAGKMKEKPL